jgi:hypothetical protein
MHKKSFSCIYVNNIVYRKNSFSCHFPPMSTGMDIIFTEFKRYINDFCHGLEISFVLKMPTHLFFSYIRLNLFLPSVRRQWNTPKPSISPKKPKDSNNSQEFRTSKFFQEPNTREFQLSPQLNCVKPFQSTKKSNNSKPSLTRPSTPQHTNRMD